MNRRKFLINAFSLVATPAVVQASSLMPVKVIPFQPYMLLRGPSLYTGEPHEVRLYEDANHPASFVGNDFFQRYIKAHSEFSGFPKQVGIAHTREDEKAMRMIEPAQPTAWQPIKKRSKPFDGRDWDGSPIGFEVSPRRA